MAVHPELASMNTPSQCDRIAAMLSDERWHSVAAIHARCGFSRLNSRVAELRSLRGMTIECRHIDGGGRGPEAYEYRWVPSTTSAAA